MKRKKNNKNYVKIVPEEYTEITNAILAVLVAADRKSVV